MAEVYRLNPQKAQQVTSSVKPKLLEVHLINYNEFIDFYLFIYL
jgi:hypothetical protein